MNIQIARYYCGKDIDCLIFAFLPQTNKMIVIDIITAIPIAQQDAADICMHEMPHSFKDLARMHVNYLIETAFAQRDDSTSVLTVVAIATLHNFVFWDFDFLNRFAQPSFLNEHNIWGVYCQMIT